MPAPPEPQGRRIDAVREALALAGVAFVPGALLADARFEPTLPNGPVRLSVALGDARATIHVAPAEAGRNALERTPSFLLGHAPLPAGVPSAPLVALIREVARRLRPVDTGAWRDVTDAVAVEPGANARELWAEWRVAPHERALSDVIHPSVLASLRLGLRPTALALLPEGDAAAAARREFRRVVPLARVVRAPDGSTSMLPPEATQGQSHVLLSNDATLPPDATLSRAWLDAGRMDAPGPDDDPDARHVRTFGRLLSYPPCCVEAFLARRRRDSLAVNLDALDAPQAADRAWPATMNHLQVDWFQLFAHYPCRYDCPATLAEARRFMEGLHRVAPRFTQALRDRLPGVTVAFENDSYLHVDGDLATGGAATRITVRRVKGRFLGEGPRDRFVASIGGHGVLTLDAAGLEWRADSGRTTTFALAPGQRAVARAFGPEPAAA